MATTARAAWEEVGERAAPARRDSRQAFVLARTYCGIAFTVAGIKQLVDAPPWLNPPALSWADAVRQQLIQWAPHSWWWYRPLVTTVWIPHADVLASLVGWGNAVVGIFLLLGVGTRLSAGVAILMLLNCLAAAGGQLYYPGPTAAYIALLVAVILNDGAPTARPDPWPLAAGRRAGILPAWTVVPLRVYFGAAFLYAASNKIGADKWTQWPGAMAGFIESQLPHAAALYRPIAAHFVLPFVGVLAPMVAVTEAVVGVALLVGGYTRVAAAVGALLACNYLLLKGTSLIDVSNDAAFIIGLMLVSITDAGRTLGLDALRSGTHRSR